MRRAERCFSDDLQETFSVKAPLVESEKAQVLHNRDLMYGISHRICLPYSFNDRLYGFVVLICHIAMVISALRKKNF